VWFSGVHTDLGGGRADHRLSDILLAWMISEWSKTRLQAFDQHYLLTRRVRTGEDLSRIPWATAGGVTIGNSGLRSREWVVKKVERMIETAPRKIQADENPTNETLHCSIFDRRFRPNESIT
jgi:hypothetical protein